MKTRFYSIILLTLLLLGCESVEDMQKRVEVTNTTANQTQPALEPSLPIAAPLPTQDDSEPSLKPSVQEIKNLLPPPVVETNTTPEVVPPEPPKTLTFVPQRQQNDCANLPKVLCNQQDACEYAVDEKTGKQYCRQRCKLYPIGECTNAGGCVIKTDRRNNTVCLTDCAAFSNADLCDRYIDCGWSQGNCTSLGYR